MTFTRLLLRNLFYHRRGNFAVLLGVALGTAVLTGALLVGDSLQGSLRELMLDRLGWIETAMMPGRFFRQDLARNGSSTQTLAAIILSGSAIKTDSRSEGRRVGAVTVLGVDICLPCGDSHSINGLAPDFWDSDRAECVLNRTLADELGAEEGDLVSVAVPRVDQIPRESLLGKRKAKDVLKHIDVRVKKVVPDDGMASFTPKPLPERARNVFVPLRFLQAAMEIPGQANALLSGGMAPMTDVDHLMLDDWGLRLRTPKDRALAFFHSLAPENVGPTLKRARWRDRIPQELVDSAEANGGLLARDDVVAFYEKRRPYISLESRQLLLSPVVANAASEANTELRSTHPERKPVMQRLFVYLVDTLATDHDFPYVVVAGVDKSKLLGPNAEVWLHGGIALVEPPGTSVRAVPGNLVMLDYYTPDDESRLQKKREEFSVTAVLPLEGPADDPDLTPEFPGITDKLDISEWKNPPFPYDSKRITPDDEKYWKRYRATPRAYLSLRKAQELWGSRFGNLTSIQFYGADAKELEAALLKQLPPERGGFVFQPVRENARKASRGSSDFSMLFLSFSIFLIVSALLLVGLLVRLNLDCRASEIGLLLAVGWTHRRVRWLLLAEGAVLAIAGGLLGSLGALAYGRLMLDLLRANWPGGESLNFLRLHVDEHSLIHGFMGALVVSVLTIFWATRVLGGLSPRALLAGETAPPRPFVRRGVGMASFSLLLCGLLGAAGALAAGFFATGAEAKAGSFFGSGALLLIAALAGVWIWLRSTGRQSSPRPTLTALGIRNAGRNAVRSLLTVGLLAAATFLIVAVESFHKEAHVDFTDKAGHKLAWIAETDVPVFQDLNDDAVRKELKLAGVSAMNKVTFHRCRVQAGDDASCLNLYQPLTPRVLGVAPELLGRWFTFGSTLKTDPPRDELWTLLEGQWHDGTIPAALDANTAQWIYKKRIGETWEVVNERGEKVKLRLVALLQESIFQSEVVISEQNFRQLFPGQQGSTFFLVETRGLDETQASAARKAIETALADQGVRVQTPAARLAAYMAVENTYLTTFQALGGLGLLLGAVGLAIILLRGVWERRGELVLLRALGFRPAQLAWLVLAENVTLLVFGLAAGALAALVSVAPHLAGAGAHVLWLRIGGLLLAVLATGLVGGGLAVAGALRAPILTALRRE